jgi:pre-mRNA-splicing factor ISY1
MITEVMAIPTCEKWRGQVLKEISRKVSKIQDPSLSDFMIRDLNDEINKAMREKHMWEVQIRNLGGPNYMRGGGKVYDEEGREIPGSGKGYRYVLFGACLWSDADGSTDILAEPKSFQV